MTKIRYLGVTLVLMIVIAGVIWNSAFKEPIRRGDQGLPQDTLERILAEREKVSSQSLETPIGKLLVSKNWSELEKSLDPKKDFLLFAEVLRASFSKQIPESLSPDETAILLEITLNLALNAPKTERAKLGLLISQLHRIPITPGPGEAVLSKLSINEKTDPWGYALVLHKWVLHAPNPGDDLIRSYQTAMKNGWSTFEKRFWIESVDQIRIPAVRNQILKTLEKELPRYSQPEQNIAYIVLTKNLSSAPATLVSFGFKLLQQSNSASVEAGLRGLTQPVFLRQLSDEQKNHLVSRLTELPDSLKSPWTAAKSAEVLSTLRAEPNLNR